MSSESPRLALTFPGILNNNQFREDVKLPIEQDITNLFPKKTSLKINTDPNHLNLVWNDICGEESTIENIYKVKSIIDAYIIEHPEYCLRIDIRERDNKSNSSGNRDDSSRDKDRGRGRARGF